MFSKPTPSVTLNVLLSFAQFEREVTGERIRDKIAASKKKGLSMEEATERLAVEFTTGRVYRYSGVPEFLFRVKLRCPFRGTLGRALPRFGPPGCSRADPAL